MTEPSGATATTADRCHYPGCTRARRPDPATGRPSRYCERADDSGGPIHNRANAWKARRTHAAGQTADNAPGAENPDAPVSMARATLEQRLAELPQRVAEVRHYLDDVLAAIRAAGDVEAAGAEVEDAHRDALTKVTEAERRATTAERSARAAEDGKAQAEQDRDEADTLAEETLADMERLRAATAADIAQIRSSAEAAVAAAEDTLTQAQARFTEQIAERDREVDSAREAATTAQIETSAASAALVAANESAERERATAAQLRDELDQTRRDFEEKHTRLQGQIDSARQEAHHATADASALRVELATAQALAESARRESDSDRAALATLAAELDRVRADERSERELLRAAHAEQLALARRSAEDRVQVLTDALSDARQALETSRKRTSRAKKAPASPSRESEGGTQGPDQEAAPPT